MRRTWHGAPKKRRGDLMQPPLLLLGILTLGEPLTTNAAGVGLVLSGLALVQT